MDQMMPNQGQMAPEQPQQGGDMEICIVVGADGQVKGVYKGPADGNESDMQPVSDVGQALKMALDMIRSLAPQGGEAAGFGSVPNDQPRAPLAQRPQRPGMMR